METNIISLLSEQITDPKEMVRQGDLTIQDPEQSTVKKPQDKPQDKPKKPEDRVKKTQDKIEDKPEDKTIKKNIKNPVNVAGKLIRVSSIKQDWINPVLIGDLERATKLAKIGDVVITTGQSNHSKFTINGDISLHWYGCAVDISKFIVNGKSITLASNPQLFTTLGNIFVEKLKSIGYKFYDQASGGGYLWQTMKGGNHYNHIHVSNTKNKKEIIDKLEFLRSKQYVTYKKIQKAIDLIYEFSQKNTDYYFKAFRKWYNDDEEAAADYFYKTCNIILKKLGLDTTPKNITERDLKTLDSLKRLITILTIDLKLNKLNTSQMFKYPYLNENNFNWQSKTLQFNWKYFKN